MQLVRVIMRRGVFIMALACAQVCRVVAKAVYAFIVFSCLACRTYHIHAMCAMNFRFLQSYYNQHCFKNEVLYSLQ